MSKSKFKLNRAGVRALLQSDPMKSVCEEHARAIRTRVGEGYEINSMVGKNRVNAMVYPKSYQAKKDNLKNNTLLKALN